LTPDICGISFTPMKVLVSLPDELVARLDAEARARRTTRSRLVQEAVELALATPSPDAIAAALERGRRALRTAGPFESSKLVRAERDARDWRDRGRR
jgi:predicted transcriptional regulator